MIYRIDVFANIGNLFVYNYCLTFKSSRDITLYNADFHCLQLLLFDLLRLL